VLAEKGAKSPHVAAKVLLAVLIMLGLSTRTEVGYDLLPFQPGVQELRFKGLNCQMSSLGRVTTRATLSGFHCLNQRGFV